MIPAGDNLDRGRSPYPNPNPSSDIGGDGIIPGSCGVLKSTDHFLDDSVRSSDRNSNSYSPSHPNPDPRPMARVAQRFSSAPDPKPMKHSKGQALKSGVMINPKSDRGGLSYPSGQIPAHPTDNNNHRHSVRVRSVEGKGVGRAIVSRGCCGEWQHPDGELCNPSPNPKQDPNPSHESNKVGVRFAPGVNNPNPKPTLQGGSGKLEVSDRCDPSRVEIRKTLAAIRDLSNVDRVKEQYCSSLPAYTIFEQATGGCLGTIAAANAGFRHLGGSEDLSNPIGEAKGRLFQELTNRRCFHDARQWEEWEGHIPNHFDYYKAGMPCPDYAALGAKKGCNGNKGGDLFITQLLFIERKLPKIVCLEMVPSALETNNGDEVRFVMTQLEHTGYTVHADIINCWEHGDPTARKRLFIVGIHETISDKAEWAWPDPIFDTSRYPIARDIAVLDDKVPPSYWRHDRPTLHTDRSLDPNPGRIQHIGYAGKESNSKNAGYSTMPNNIQGWDGLGATQLGTNGGSRRVRLTYKLGDPIGDTRMTVPLETCRYASVHEASYMALARRHHPGKQSGINQDQWLRELVNLGIPLATGTAIDMAVVRALKSAGVQPSDELGDALSCSHFLPLDDPNQCEDVDDGLVYPMDNTTNTAYSVKGQGVQGLTVSIGDSGASDNLGEHEHFAQHMYNTRPSGVKYQTAGDGTYIKGEVVGEIDISVLNLSSQPNCGDWVDHTPTLTTIRGIGDSLFSLEAHFRDQGYDIHLSHGYDKNDYTGMYRPPERDQQRALGKVYGPESFIPMIYNWRGMGGWKVPYVIRAKGTTDEQHRAVLEGILLSERDCQARVARSGPQSNGYSIAQGQHLERLYWAYSVVAEQLVVRTQGERNIRPAFTYGGLRRHKGSKWHDLHSDWAHLGEPGKPCRICDMFKGASRRMPRHREGKPRESRPGHTWYMDMITFRHRSEEGCKYMIVLTDSTTQFYQLIPLYWKSDATHEIRRWIKTMREHPSLVDIPYRMISHIITDNDGAWSEDNAEYQAMLEAIGGVEMEYGDPADHARDNARAEGSNKIIEAGIQSLLYERNLPPSWWQRAANDVMFLSNRLPVYSLDANVPSDGDLAPPMEQLLHGYISRNQVYRELDSYVGIGTPALCHLPKVKGSDLEPKVRWGIAIGHRGKVTRWMCPFTHTQFKSRSFTAHILRQGLNWSQFLGLGDIAPSKQSKMIASYDEDEQWTIELPEQRPCVLKLPPPVKEILDVSGDQLALLHPNVTSKDLCEFYPRLTRRDHRRLKQRLDHESEPNSDDSDDEVEADVKSLEVVDSHGKQLTLDSGSLPHLDDRDYLHCDGCDNNLSDSDPEEEGTLTPSSKPKPEPTPHPEKDETQSEKVKGKKGKGKRGRPKGSKRKLSGQPIDDDIDESLVIDAYGIDSDIDNEIEEYEAKTNAKHAIVTDGKLTWARVCKHMHKVHNNLPHERHNIYRLWLLTKPIRYEESQLYVENLPKDRCDSRSPLDAGITLPYPSGPHWNRLCGDLPYRKQHKDKIHPEELEEEQAYLAMRAYRAMLYKGYVSLALAGRALVAQAIDPDDFQSLLDDMISEDIQDIGYTAYCARKYSTAHKARKIGGGQRTTIAIVILLLRP